MSSESIIKIVYPISLKREGKIYFLIVVAIAKEVVWKSRLKGTGNFISSWVVGKHFCFPTQEVGEAGEESPATKHIQEK